MVMISDRARSLAQDSDSIKMDSFRKIKPTCVALMSIATISPSASSQHAALLSSLLSGIHNLPQEAFTQNMINYILFPLTQILRANDPLSFPEPFLESSFRLLSFLIWRWRDTPGGIEQGAWEQLWRFTIGCAGPARGKGKGKELSQETRSEAVELLSALLSPSGVSGDRKHPSASMKISFSTSRSPLMSTLFQSISFLLDQISPNPPHLNLQLSSVRLLKSLIGYVKGQHPLLASLLPGIVSGITKVVQMEGKALKGDVGEGILNLFEEIIVLTLNDEDLTGLNLLRPDIEDLTQLADQWEEPPGSSEIPDRSPSPTPSTATNNSSKQNPFPPLTRSYLSFTASQLLSALPPIMTTLASHSASQARIALSALSASLISKCSESLPDLVGPSLRTLLSLSQDSFDPVRHDARRRLRLLKFDSLGVSLVDLLSSAMNGLPRAIMSRQDDKVSQSALVVISISELLASVSISDKRNAVSGLLGPEGKVERWGWNLLDCLEFGLPVGWSSNRNSNTAKLSMLGWTENLGSKALLTNGVDDRQSVQPFPEPVFRYIESPQTAKKIGEMLITLGSSGGEPILHSVDFFVSFARNHSDHGIVRAGPALWVAAKLLEGLSKSEMEGIEGKIGRRTRKTAKEIVRILVSMDEDLDHDESYDRQGAASDALLPVQREKGLNALTTLLDKPIPKSGFIAEETRRLHASGQKILLDCRSLVLLALTASILSSNFRPLLLNSLYSILSHLASPHPLVQEYAEIALAQIAYHTGYASTQNLILDNVDYVVNVVSRRLTPSQLSVQAPLVLIAMIRLVGSEIVPLVHDVVDEIFDALDNYHGYEALTSSLLAVLSTLIKVMSADVISEGMSEERKKKLEELRRVDNAPNPEKDFGKFEKWYASRKESRQEEISKILEKAPERKWGAEPKDPNEEEQEDQEDQPMEEKEIPLNRSEEVCKQILEKSIYFLSHPNSFLRSRILSLIASSIPILAATSRESDLLPLVDRAWPLIITRLNDPESYVVTEAAEVIASLSQYVGDFMGRRILDNAWPKFSALLKAQFEKDQHSALTKRGSQVVGTESSFTTSHRLHIAILEAMRWVSEEVPVDDQVLWKMMIQFRSFLDRRANEELQREAKEVYLSLGKRDGDAVWTVLKSTLGSMKGDNGTWTWLVEPGLDITINAEEILMKI